MPIQPLLRRVAYVALGTAGIILLFCVWFAVASDYDYGMLSGTYVLESDGVSSKLILRKDASFHQAVTDHGKTTEADGHWHRIGEGGVNFSSEFLRVPGAQTFIESQPGHGDGTPADEQFYGHFEKFLTLYPRLELDGGATFHKRLFR